MFKTKNLFKLMLKNYNIYLILLISILMNPLLAFANDSNSTSRISSSTTIVIDRSINTSENETFIKTSYVVKENDTVKTISKNLNIDEDILFKTKNITGYSWPNEMGNNNNNKNNKKNKINNNIKSEEPLNILPIGTEFIVNRTYSDHINSIIIRTPIIDNKNKTFHINFLNNKISDVMIISASPNGTNMQYSVYGGSNRGYKKNNKKSGSIRRSFDRGFRRGFGGY